MPSLFLHPQLLNAYGDGLSLHGSLPAGPEPCHCLKIWQDGSRAVAAGAEFNGVLLVDVQKACVADVIMGHLAKVR